MSTTTPDERANTGGTTPNFHLRWPPSTAPADPPVDLENLAMDSDGALLAVERKAGERNTAERGELNHKNEEQDAKIASNTGQINSLVAWQGPANTQIYTTTPNRITALEQGREPIPSQITHSYRGYDLPTNPRWGERVIIAIEPATFTTQPEADRVNRPIWEFVYYGRWYFTGGTPIMSFFAGNSGVISGGGTWQYLGPTIYTPYPKMVFAVRFGAKLDAPPGVNVLGAIGNANVLSGQPAGEGPSILELEGGTSGVVAAVASMGVVMMGFGANDDSMAHWGACTAGQVYRHSYRWTEFLPLEIIYP